ncbi:hypothetical protein [Streptomyces sp. WAC 01529]|nr:hypothetical protein [Streptomyces sp. WAC 01529]
MTGTWGVIAGILGATALVGSGLFAGRATPAAARTTAEAMRA